MLAMHSATWIASQPFLLFTFLRKMRGERCRLSCVLNVVSGVSWTATRFTKCDTSFEEGSCTSRRQEEDMMSQALIRIQRSRRTTWTRTIKPPIDCCTVLYGRRANQQFFPQNLALISVTLALCSLSRADCSSPSELPRPVCSGCWGGDRVSAPEPRYRIG